MGDMSAIEWTDATWNPTTGCDRTSPGCDNCYALSHREAAEGDGAVEVSSSTFWHGTRMDEWANAWTRYYTGGQGNYMIAAMEDTGTLQALTFLSQAGRVDLKRVLVLRTVSNYDREAPGSTPAESLKSMVGGKYAAYLPALEGGGNCWRQSGS